MPILTGTENDDILAGGADNDTLLGLGGADYLFGGDGDDFLAGGEHNDILYGEAGNDALDGGAGNDILLGNEGHDRLAGGAGDDLLVDDAGDNTLLGGDGDDTLRSHGSGRNRLDGGAGNDVLEGGAGDDQFDGGAGDDVLRVSAGWGETSAAYTLLLAGGEGKDRFETLLGSQTPVQLVATGGAGRDTFELANPGQASRYTITDFSTGADGDMLSIRKLIGTSDYLKFSVNPFASGHIRLLQDGADTQVQFDIDGSAGPAAPQSVAILSGVPAASLGIHNMEELLDPFCGVTGVTLNGDDGNNTLNGGMLIDTLFGAGGDDYLAGGGGDDLLDGGAGDDILLMEAGSDTLMGGPGRDTVLFLAERSNFVITEVAGGLRVVDLLGLGSTALLSGVERLRFLDAARAYDIDGIGGQVYRIYQAAFDRVPDRDGLGFWIAKADAGMALADITAGFVASAEFAALYGAAPSNAEIVARFYQNVLQRAPDAGGQAFWIDILDRQLAGVAEVLASFSESPENKLLVDAAIGQGFEYIPYG